MKGFLQKEAAKRFEREVAQRKVASEMEDATRKQILPEAAESELLEKEVVAPLDVTGGATSGRSLLQPGVLAKLSVLMLEGKGASAPRRKAPETSDYAQWDDAEVDVPPPVTSVEVPSIQLPDLLSTLRRPLTREALVKSGTGVTSARSDFVRSDKVGSVVSALSTFLQSVRKLGTREIEGPSNASLRKVGGATRDSANEAEVRERMEEKQRREFEKEMAQNANTAALSGQERDSAIKEIEEAGLREQFERELAAKQAASQEPARRQSDRAAAEQQAMMKFLRKRAAEKFSKSVAVEKAQRAKERAEQRAILEQVRTSSTHPNPVPLFPLFLLVNAVHGIAVPERYCRGKAKLGDTLMQSMLPSSHLTGNTCTAGCPCRS